MIRLRRSSLPRRHHRRSLYALTALLLCCAAVYLSGCTAVRMPGPADPAEAARRWQRFLAQSSVRQQNAGPFSLTASLRYRNQDSGHRVTMRMWGNGPAPLRLDVEAGVGALIAQIREEKGLFVAYSPREATALVHEGDGSPALALGIPVPFTIQDMAALLQGRFGKFFAAGYDRTEVVADGTIAYSLPSQAGGAGTLLLDALARPVRWTGASGWHVAFSRYENTPDALPERIDMIISDTRQATIFVKSRQKHAAAYTPAELALTLPPDTHIRPVRQR
jgi:outer membrane biogenesis lipoprotein LolB